jgi:hypothetical protein
MADDTTNNRHASTGLQRVIDVDSAEGNTLWAMPHASDAPPTKPIIERQSDDLAA